MGELQRGADGHGEAVQVAPIKPNLIAPGTKRLKLNTIDCFEVLLSKSTCAATTRRRGGTSSPPPPRQGLTLVQFPARRKRFLRDRGCTYGLFTGSVGVNKGLRGCLGYIVYFVPETAQVELNSGQV